MHLPGWRDPSSLPPTPQGAKQCSLLGGARRLLPQTDGSCHRAALPCRVCTPRVRTCIRRRLTASLPTDEGGAPECPAAGERVNGTSLRGRLLGHGGAWNADAPQEKSDADDSTLCDPHTEVGKSTGGGALRGTSKGSAPEAMSVFQNGRQ